MTVSGDGRGKEEDFHRYLVSTLVEKYSKKVADAVVKSSFCQACDVWNRKKENNIDEYNEWYESHEETCSINHEGSVG